MSHHLLELVLAAGRDAPNNLDLASASEVPGPGLLVSLVRRLAVAAGAEGWVGGWPSGEVGGSLAALRLMLAEPPAWPDGLSATLPDVAGIGTLIGMSLQVKRPEWVETVRWCQYFVRRGRSVQPVSPVLPN